MTRHYNLRKKERGITVSNFRFSSNAEEIRFYVKELLKDGKMYSREEIMNYVKTQSPKGGSFTEGMYTGAIRDLVRNSNGLYINPIRGHYQQAPQSPGQLAGIELRFKIIDVLNEACDNLSKACTINIIGLPVEDLAVANKVAQIIDRLKIDINEIQSFGQTPPKRRKDID